MNQEECKRNVLLMISAALATKRAQGRLT